MDPQLEISDIAFGGNGVARFGGKVYFVPFTISGERVTARVVRDRKKFVEAELVEVHRAAHERVEPRCPYFGRCGGCSYQHISYERQLEIKQHQVEQTLRRIGRLPNLTVDQIIPSPKDYGYRNRIRVHVEAGVVGFYAHRSHELIDIAECPISAPQVNEALADVRQRALADGDYALAARDLGPFFEQTNDAVAEAMVNLVREKVRAENTVLVDAYCGAGLFAKQLRGQFQHVIGIEENAYAVERAQRTATANERYIAGDVGIFLAEVLQNHDPAVTTVVLDPPATGVSTRVADILVGSAPQEIVYVSCNPATLARDLSLLTGLYEVISVTPLDMFPQTAEIEVVAHLRLAKAR